MRVFTVTVLASLFAAAATGAFERSLGAGLNVVTANVVKGEKRNGVSLQPALWADLPEARSLLTLWGSVGTITPRLDDVVIDLRSGFPTAGWGWVGGMVHWDWNNPLSDSLRAHSLEVGPSITWFRPPYRPSLTLTYDIVQQNGALLTASAPYTIRMTWLPPTTFIPEVALRFAGAGNKLSAEYFSFSAMLERRFRGFAVLPAAGVFPKRQISRSVLWAGIHVNAVK